MLIPRKKNPILNQKKHASLSWFVVSRMTKKKNLRKRYAFVVVQITDHQRFEILKKQLLYTARFSSSNVILSLFKWMSFPKLKVQINMIESSK